GAYGSYRNADRSQNGQQSPGESVLRAWWRSRTERGWLLSTPADPTPSVSECVGLSVGLRRAKGVEGHASLEDRSQGAVVVERTVEALGIENLRHEANVGHGDGVAIAEATGEASASQVSLQTSQSLRDPMAIPHFGPCLSATEFRPDA